MDKQSTIRLDKYLANAGIVSRRAADKFLKENKVLANGKRLLKSGERINPSEDLITINDEKLRINADFTYIILNKPLNVVSTTNDPENRKAVTDLVKSTVRLYPVGRLDSDSIGLILLTNDGEVTHKLTHPKFHIPKTYEVLVKDKPNNSQLNHLRNGVMLKDGKTLPAEIEITEEFRFTTKLKIVLHEGRNRQIRRMCGKVGLEILELKRVSIGPINLGNLKLGEFRELTNEEVLSLKTSVNL